MKNKVIEIVEAELAGAEDNLYRANMQFRNADPESEHGQSGRKCGQIWQLYKDEVEDLKKAKSWLLSVMDEYERTGANSHCISSTSSPYGEYEAINGAIANRLIKELEDTRREAEEFRDDMNVHLTEGDGKFTWENH